MNLEVLLYDRVTISGRVEVVEEYLCDGESHYRVSTPQDSFARCDRIFACNGNHAGSVQEKVNVLDLSAVVQTAMQVAMTVDEKVVVVHQREDREGRPRYRFYIAGRKISPSILMSPGCHVLHPGDPPIIVRTQYGDSGTDVLPAPISVEMWNENGYLKRRTQR